MPSSASALRLACCSALLFLAVVDAHNPNTVFPSASREEVYSVLSTQANALTRARVAELWGSSDNSTITPEQLHLSLGGDPTEMTIMWVTMGNATGAVTYWPLAAPGNNQTVASAESTYQAGMFGWTGTIHTATMTGLTPGSEYQYTVGSGVPGSPTWSLPRKFFAAPNPSATATSFVAVTADMGTILPMGWAVADEIINEHFNGPQPFDFVLIAGDISYATIDPPKNEGEQVER
jgi:hypothetical protein